MHNITHSLAHRAPPASRIRGRWQPYNSIQPSSASSSSSSSSRASPANYLYTPATSVSESPAPLCDTDVARQHAQQPPTLPKECRDGSKSKFALSLVDSSVKTLCDIWRPQHIPPVFNSLKAPILSRAPITTASPVLLHPSDSQSPLVPIRGFVHEVLRRSRTSGGVLQTALCYLEAIRPKLSELISLEQQGEGPRGEPETSSTITMATEAELQLERDFVIATQTDDILCTVRASTDSESSPAPPLRAKPSPETSNLPAPAVSLPSPLLCPRRTFLAALILATKFTQDKCYSNRAWAKLSGLSPREIGRCERALGNALDWRLWVGKAAVPAAPATSPAQTHKSFTRTQSEPNLLGTANTITSSEAAAPATKAGLRRASTLPASAFARSPENTGPQSSSPPFIASANVAKPLDSYSTSNSSGSPLSEVPGLSHSPSSTESSISSGERTIQMSTFLDDNMTLPPSESFNTQSWPWLGDDSLSLDGANPNAVHTSTSPVAVINGKLLTGSGLSGFQNKLKPSHSWTASTAMSFSAFGSFSGEAQIPPYGGLRLGADNVQIYDPTATSMAQ